MGFGDLDSVGELHPLDDLWQLVVAAQAPPAFLRGFDQLEHHGKRGLVRQTALRSDCPVPYRGERALDWIGRAQVQPMLGREVVERQEDVAIPGQAFDRLLVFRPVGVDEEVERDERIVLSARRQPQAVFFTPWPGANKT